jgi:hypothetical protein
MWTDVSEEIANAIFGIEIHPCKKQSATIGQDIFQMKAASEEWKLQI